MSSAIRSQFAEFKPTIAFLLRFIGLFVVASLVYGFFIPAYEPGVDPVTRAITHQASAILNFLGWATQSFDYPGKSTTSLQWQGKGIISVYEGCNGLNVMVVFLSFIFAFGPLNKTTGWFILVALTTINLANLARIILLFFVVIYLSAWSYFAHKYLFTAFIYVIVLALWIIWVRKYGGWKK